MRPDWLRTHDDALDLLRAAVPGAVVELAPTRAGGEGARAYQITLVGARIRVSGGDTYHLPCLAAPIARRAREIADGLRESVRQ